LKFLLEADLDKLAKWMRFLGQDVLVLKEAINKRSIVEHIDRIFITTSRKWEKHLRDWRVNYLILPRDDWKVQLCLILKHFQIKPKLLLNRCPHCNAELELISKEDVKSAIHLWFTSLATTLHDAQSVRVYSGKVHTYPR